MRIVIIAFIVGSSVLGTASTGQGTNLPQLLSASEQENVQAVVEKALKSKSLPPSQVKNYSNALTRYFSFLGLQASNAAFSSTLSRVLGASTQFLICDVEDWACLEKTPALSPSASYRQDTAPNLGAPVKAGTSLEMEWFFTKRWRKGAPQNEPTVADLLGGKLLKDGKRSVRMALYGIDDINGSMKPVFTALTTLAKSSRVYGVFDVNGGGVDPNSFLREYDVKVTKSTGKINIKDAPEAISFSYAQPHNPDYWAFGRPAWMDDVFELGQSGVEATYTNQLQDPKKAPKYQKDINWLLGKVPLTFERSPLATRMTYQYQETASLIRVLNANISNNEQARGRIEWPMPTLMHNKFFIMEDASGQRYVWTGTTNVSKTCMGDESNSNMAVYIKNEAIADAFEQEFNEMFQSPLEDADSSKPSDLLTGRFHTTKTPNTPRYFVFDDGTEARVHFSPTDDGEHRAILPMLLSAQKGDIIRISMFGGSGFETVRALQVAAARGARVQIVFDKLTSAGTTSWWKSPKGNVLDKNPYAASANVIEARNNSWKGLNHYKAGSLSRVFPDGKERAVVFIVGSQNWSASGNDDNDENMMTIRNAQAGVPAGDAFNAEFDDNLWPNSVPVPVGGKPKKDPAPKKASTKPKTKPKA